MIEIFTIYNNPLDFPGCFVCKKWVFKDGGQVYQDGSFENIIHVLLDDVEKELIKKEPNLYKLGRSFEDDPVIVCNYIR